MSEALRSKLAREYAGSAIESARYARTDINRAKKSFEIYSHRARNEHLDDRSRKLYAELADAADQLVAWHEEVEDKATSLAAHLRNLADDG